MTAKFKWSRVQFNEHMLGIRESKCGRAKIIKLNPPNGMTTTYDEYVPVLDGEFLPRYYKLREAKRAIEAHANGEPLPKVGKPNHRFEYENVGVDEETKRQYRQTVEDFKQRVRNGTTKPPDRPRNPYEVLGLDETADLSDCKKAYRRLAKQYHPDHNPDDDAAVETFRQIKLAWETIQALAA